MVPPSAKKLPHIIQIDVTSACDLSCSNCTRMLRHQPKKYEMSVEVFRQSCRILHEALPHFIIGLFGGNPAVSKNFPEYCRIMQQEIPDQSKRGLWCNHLRGHGAIARETFYPRGFFTLNAHTEQEAVAQFAQWLPGKMLPFSGTRKSWHSPTLMAIQDFVGTPAIPDEKAMWDILNRCDIDRDWSACVIERDGVPFLYSCEIQAAFELVYGDVAPQGWLTRRMAAHPGESEEQATAAWIEQGKAARVPLTVESATASAATFEAQYRRWCPQCGIAMRVRGHEDMDFTDDYSKTHEPMVQLNVRRKAVLHETTLAGEARCAKATDYQRMKTRV